MALIVTRKYCNTKIKALQMRNETEKLTAEYCHRCQLMPRISSMYQIMMDFLVIIPTFS